MSGLNDFLKLILASFLGQSFVRNLLAQQLIEIKRPCLIRPLDENIEVEFQVFAFKTDKFPRYTRRVHKERPLYIDKPCYIKASKSDPRIDLEFFLLSKADFEYIEDFKHSKC